MFPEPGSLPERLLVRSPPQEQSVRGSTIPERQIQVPIRLGKSAQKPTLFVLPRSARQSHRKRSKERSRPGQIPVPFVARKAEPPHDFRFPARSRARLSIQKIPPTKELQIPAVRQTDR